MELTSIPLLGPPVLALNIRAIGVMLRDPKPIRLGHDTIGLTVSVIHWLAVHAVLLQVAARPWRCNPFRYSVVKERTKSERA